MQKFFSYQDDRLHAEAVDLTALAASTSTPFYCYAANNLRENYQTYAAALSQLNPTLHYAVKANSNQAVLKIFAALGAGADVVSGGELARALAAGIPADKIVFSSVGKTEEEMTAGLKAGIYQFNVESIPELYVLNKVAQGTQRRAPVALRINPDVDAGSHEKLSTGHKETKFGIEVAQLSDAMHLATSLPGLDFVGLTVHIGTDIDDYSPFRLAFERMAVLVRHWRAEGATIERLDLGGGVPIAYDGDIEHGSLHDYAAIVTETVGKLDCKIGFEPGRRLVGDAGILVTRVLYVKDTPTKRFVVVDAAMNDLARPALYQARHSVIPIKQSKGPKRPATLVGPVCETGDLFGENYLLPDEIQAGDLLAILQAGAYGSSMASTYNTRPLIAEMLVDGDKSALIRRRISPAEQMAWESAPDWV